MASLNGRVGRLEQRFGPAVARAACRTCGREHAPVSLSIALIRSALGVYRPGDEGYRDVGRLCHCACCPMGRGLAELTH